MAVKKTKLPAAVCENCSTIFEFEERDEFLGEVFCPGCMSRVLKGGRYKDLRSARVKNKKLAVYADR